MVRIHPDTGRKNLFIGRHASHILGEELESSRELLRELTVAACQSPRTLKHDWTPGDIVIWDNRCVLHRGHEWPDDAARVMVRSTVAGDGASYRMMSCTFISAKRQDPRPHRVLCSSLCPIFPRALR